MKKKKTDAENTRPLISLRTLFGILFFLLMIGTIVLSYLFNTLFLERYYLSDRKKALAGVYQDLQHASVQELLSTDQFDLSMRETLRQGNMSLLVMDSNTRTVKIWSADEMLMEERLYANIFNLTPIEEEPSQSGDDEDNEDIEHFTGGEATGGTRDGDGLYDSNDKEQSDRFLYEDEYVITQILEEEKPYTINIVL